MRGSFLLVEVAVPLHFLRELTCSIEMHRSERGPHADGHADANLWDETPTCGLQNTQEGACRTPSSGFRYKMKGEIRQRMRQLHG